MINVKWLVPKEALETVVGLLENVPSRNGIKSSEFIKVTALGKDGATFHLSSTLFGKATLRTGELFPFEEPLFLDRRLFIPFVNSGKESKATDYMFVGGKSQLLVQHGSRRAIYTYALPVAGYEEPKGLESANSTSVQKRWISMIDCAANCATDDPITPTLNCVYVIQNGNKITATATNNMVAFYGSVETDKKPLASAIAYPLGLVQALRQEGATKLLWTDKLACVEFPKGRIWQAVKTAARKGFPYKDVRALAKNAIADPVVCSVPGSAFAKACDRLSRYVAALEASDMALELYITKGSRKIAIKAGIADSKFTELLNASNEATADLVLEWPLSQVLPVILFAADEGHFRIHVSKKGTSCLATKNIVLMLPKVSKAK